MKTALAFLLLAIVAVGCSNGNTHKDIKVKALHAWEKGRAKNCMLLTGRSVVEGGKDGPDPKEMWCRYEGEDEPGVVRREYIHISNVSLDAASEKEFHARDKWAVPVVCEEVSESELKCVFDGSR